jgi:hypothetical protein
MTLATVRPSAYGAILLSLRRPLSLPKQTFSLLPYPPFRDVPDGGDRRARHNGLGWPNRQRLRAARQARRGEGTSTATR